MIDSLHGPLLSDFAHRGLVRSRDPAGRILAAAATALLYAVLLFLALRGFAWVMPVPDAPGPVETVRLLPVARMPRLEMRDFNVHLIKPRAENAPMPEIVIAPAPSNAPRASLPATAARDTAMAGGSATGSAAGAVNGVGTGGNGKGMAACMDQAYLEQIMHHVGRWYFYPDLTMHMSMGGRAYGIVYVHFVIDKSGHYLALDKLRGSGNPVLDAAAMRTMRNAEPLPPIPDRFHTDRLDGDLPIIYSGATPLKPEQFGHGAGGC